MPRDSSLELLRVPQEQRRASAAEYAPPTAAAPEGGGFSLYSDILSQPPPATQQARSSGPQYTQAILLGRRTWTCQLAESIAAIAAESQHPNQLHPSCSWAECTLQGAATAAVDIKKKPRRLSERAKNNSTGSGAPRSDKPPRIVCSPAGHEVPSLTYFPAGAEVAGCMHEPATRSLMRLRSRTSRSCSSHNAGMACMRTGSDVNSLATSPLGSRNNSGPLSSLGQLVSGGSGSSPLQKDGGLGDLRTAPPKRQVRFASSSQDCGTYTQVCSAMCTAVVSVLGNAMLLFCWPEDVVANERQRDFEATCCQ